MKPFCTDVLLRLCLLFYCDKFACAHGFFQCSDDALSTDCLRAKRIFCKRRNVFYATSIFKSVDKSLKIALRLMRF